MATLQSDLRDLRCRQRAAALEQATYVRKQRARWRRRLRWMPPREALRAAAELIIDPPDWARAWAAASFLEALPTVGPYRAGGMLRRAGVFELRKLHELSHRQAKVIADELLEHGGRR